MGTPKPLHSPFRIPPSGRMGDYITYSINATPDVGVVAACKDVGCQAWARGWETYADEATDLGRSQAAYIRLKSRRTFTERRTGDGVTVFRFESFQRCFADHRTKPDMLLKSNGDFRTNWLDEDGVYRMQLGGIRRFARVQDWTEDFQEHQGSRADDQQKG